MATKIFIEFPINPVPPERNKMMDTNQSEQIRITREPIINPTRVGRNAACPCGAKAGEKPKKFKNCCLNKIKEINNREAEGHET